jgi:hypothetical protein
MNIDKRYAHRSTATQPSCCGRARRSRTCTSRWIPEPRAPGRLPAAARSGRVSTNPDVDVDQILSLARRRHPHYLLLLLSGAARRSSGPRHHLAARRARRGREPAGTSSGSSRSTATPSRSRRCWRHAGQPPARDPQPEPGRRLARRRRHQLASLVRSSDTNFTAISDNDAQLESALTQFPGTLRRPTRRSARSRSSRPSPARRCRRSSRSRTNSRPALAAARPLFHDTTPVIANQLRPFSVAVQPLARTLAPAAAALNQATPSLTRSVGVLNTVQHARLPARQAANRDTCSGAPGWPHRRQPDRHPGCRRPDRPRPVHGELPAAQPARGDEPTSDPALDPPCSTC